MKLKAIEILNIYDSLVKISEAEFDLNTACIIANNIKSLSATKETIDAKRNDIIAKYAEKNEQGEINSAENGEAKIVDIGNFNVELNDLLISVVEVDLKTISKSVINDVFKDSKISPKVILSLMDILED